MLFIVEVRDSVVFEAIVKRGELLFWSNFDSNRIALIARTRIGALRGAVEGGTQAECEIGDAVRARSCRAQEGRGRGRDCIPRFDFVSLICFRGID